MSDPPDVICPSLYERLLQKHTRRPWYDTYESRLITPLTLLLYFMAYCFAPISGALVSYANVACHSHFNLNISPHTPLVVDDTLLMPYDRILLTRQDNASDNGVYIVHRNYRLTRAPDFSKSWLLKPITCVVITTGNTSRGHMYFQHTTPKIIGVDEWTWSDRPHNKTKVGLTTLLLIKMFTVFILFVVNFI